MPSHNKVKRPVKLTTRLSDELLSQIDYLVRVGRVSSRTEAVTASVGKLARDLGWQSLASRGGERSESLAAPP